MDIKKIKDETQGMTGKEIKDYIQQMDIHDKEELLNNRQFIEDELSLADYYIVDIIKTLDKDELKIHFINQYEIYGINVLEVLRTCTDEFKEQLVLNGDKGYDYNKIISLLPREKIREFIQKNHNLLSERDVSIQIIIDSIEPKEERVKFCEEELLNLKISNAEKKKIYATLDDETKDAMKIERVPKEYKEAFQIRKDNTLGMIIPDLNGDIDKYIDLDEVLYINPMHMSEADIQKLPALLEKAPNSLITDDLNMSKSTIEEYIIGEQWINEVIKGLKNEWSDIQKIAYIDNQIGKKIIYTPSFDTEICNEADARALWKIIAKGEGICNGIAQIEKYMLKMINIESELVYSGRHAFLKIKDIDIPTDDGVKNGNTVLDPTWNLMAHRFGGFPPCFCLSYEEIRKNDIRVDGFDQKSHKNDEILSDCTLNLDEKYLRSVYKSIGVAREDGQFPIKDLIDKSKEISQMDLSQDKKVEKELELLSIYRPDFANSINETTGIINDISLDNMEFKKCVVNRVYNKDDINKDPVLYVFIDMNEIGKRFYIADKEQRKFIEKNEQEFNEEYECYEEDMDLFDGRPWQSNIEIEEDLNKSSGKIIDEKLDDGEYQ